MNYSKLNQKYKASVVKRLQEGLKNLGYNPDPIDGVLGPKTVKALMEYNSSSDRIPVNAIGSSNQWMCKNGYKKVGNKCIK